jgi:hypothetical protein
MINNNTPPSLKRALFSLTGIIGVLILSVIFLQLLKQKIVTNYDVPNSSITAIAIDANGQPWIGSPDSVFTLTSGGTWNTYTTSNSKLPSGSVAALIIDSQNRVWVGTTSGLGLLTPEGTWETLLNERVFALATDQQGGLWVATEKKISLLSNGQWTDYTSEDSGLSIPVYAIVVDQDRQMWTTDRIRIDILSPNGNWIKDIANKVIKPRYNGIRALAIDNQNRVWVGTENGLAECVGQQCTLYYPNLANDLELRRPTFPYNIRALAFDSSNRLWGSNGNDIYILNVFLASLFERFLSIQWLEDILVFVLAYVYGVRQFPKKNNALVGALGGGLAFIVMISWGFPSEQPLILYVFPFLFLIAFLISLIVGMVAGFIGGKIGGEIAAYISGGAGVIPIVFVLLLASAQ